MESDGASHADEDAEEAEDEEIAERNGDNLELGDTMPMVSDCLEGEESPSNGILEAASSDAHTMECEEGAPEESHVLVVEESIEDQDIDDENQDESLPSNMNGEGDEMIDEGSITNLKMVDSHFETCLFPPLEEDAATEEHELAEATEQLEEMLLELEGTSQSISTQLENIDQETSLDTDQDKNGITQDALFTDEDEPDSDDGAISEIAELRKMNSVISCTSTGTCDSEHPLEVNDSDLYSEEAAELYKLVNSDDLYGVRMFIQQHKEEVGNICLIGDEKGETPVTLAGTLGLVRIIREFHDAGVWLHCSDKGGYMAIHRAAHNGHDSVVKYLAEHGQWIYTTKSGFTALHIAASVGNVEIIDVLLKYIPNVNCDTNNGWSALNLASYHGYYQAVRVLLENGADVNWSNMEGSTSLHLAAQHAHNDVIKILLDKGANINAVDTEGMTPIILATQVSTVILLVGKDADLSVKDSKGLSVLHKAVNYEWELSVIHLLCEKGHNVDARSESLTSPLFLAVVHRNKEIVVALLEHNADPNLQDVMGWSPLYLAAKQGQCGIVDLLLEHGGDPNIQNKKGSSALYAAAKGGSYGMVIELLKHKGDPNLPQNAGLTPMHIATQTKKVAVLLKLLDASGDPNVPDKDGRTPLAIAAFNHNSQILKLFFPKGNDPLGLFRVARLGNLALLQTLIVEGFNLNVKNMYGWNALHYACQEGNLSAVTSLILANIDINSLDYESNSPLHIAVMNGHGPVVHHLLLQQHGCRRINHPNFSGTKCLFIAVQIGNAEITSMLLCKGAHINEKEMPNKYIPLFYAVKSGSLETVELLCRRGASINWVSEDQMTPALFASQLGHVNIMKHLVELGADFTATTTGGMTCLHLAAQNGHLQTVLEMILTSGIDANKTTTFSNKKALHFAAEEGHLGIVEALLNAGTTVSLVDQDDRVVYCLAKHLEIWNVLKMWATYHPQLVDAPALLSPPQSRVNTPVASPRISPQPSPSSSPRRLSPAYEGNHHRRLSPTPSAPARLSPTLSAPPQDDFDFFD